MYLYMQSVYSVWIYIYIHFQARKTIFVSMDKYMLFLTGTVIPLSIGIIKGDEIMVINGAIVSDLDMMYIESVLQEEFALCMMMR